MSTSVTADTASVPAGASSPLIKWPCGCKFEVVKVEKRSPLAVIASLAGRVAASYRRWQDVRRLETFSDSMLADIGLGRGEVGTAVRYGRPATSPPNMIVTIPTER